MSTGMLDHLRFHFLYHRIAGSWSNIPCPRLFLSSFWFKPWTGTHFLQFLIHLGAGQLLPFPSQHWWRPLFQCWKEGNAMRRSWSLAPVNHELEIGYYIYSFFIIILFGLRAKGWESLSFAIDHLPKLLSRLQGGFGKWWQRRFPTEL